MEDKKLRTKHLVDFYNTTETVISQLPIDIDGFKIDSVITYCGTCGDDVLEANTHGKATKPLFNTAAFHTVSVCHKCKTITEAVFRYKKIGKDLMRIERLNREGRWVASEKKIRHGLLDWLYSFIKSTFGVDRG